MDHGAFPSLPATFSVSGQPEFALTVLQPASVDLANLSPHCLYNKKTVFVLLDVAPVLRNSSAFQVKRLDNAGNAVSDAFLVKCGGIQDAFSLVDIDRAFNHQQNSNGIDNDLDSCEVAVTGNTIEGSLCAWKVEPQIDLSRRDKTHTFSMKPPTPLLSKRESAVSYTISPQSEKNPLSFLLSRYYNTLYSLTTPLSYFPKTALVRFKNMCGNDISVVKSNLLSVYLTPVQLEQRFESRFGDVLSAEKFSSATSNYEAENGRLFVERHLDDLANEETQRKLVLELKIREAQLQVLILMELMLAWPIDDTFLEKMQNTKPVNSRQSLVRRKGSKKKIIPTFLGVGVHEVHSPEKPSTNEVNELVLYKSLITLVDLMSIWDTILGRIKGEKDESMYGFLAYVLVPFFNKQLPNIVLFIISKVKELRPKLRVRKQKTRKTLLVLENGDAETGGSKAKSVDTSDAEAPKRSRFAKALLSPEQKPLLRRAATVGVELQPAFLLKRSKSSLSTKSLKRRQVDMSITSSTDDEPRKSRLFLFGDARRVKSVATSDVQVGATPMKKSNSATFVRPDSMSYPKSQVLATPSNVRVVSMNQEILETPGFARPKGPSLVEQFEMLAPNSSSKGKPSTEKFNSMKITSSPVRESIENTPVLFLHPTAIDSSPQVTSSPVKMAQRRKPGEPVSLVESPFFRTLNGLPPAKQVLFRTKLRRKPLVEAEPELLRTESSSNLTNTREVQSSGNLDLVSSFGGTDTDSESDSDFEKLLTVRPVIRKYTRR